MTTTQSSAKSAARIVEQTMKAIVQHRYGSADVLQLEEIDVPLITDDEVLVRVRAASINHGDWVMTTGLPMLGRLAFGPRRPNQKVRGMDLAGKVEAVGANVTGFRVGDGVYGQVQTGSFAEYTRVSPNLLALKPTNLSFELAAAVPVSANTALQGLRDVGKIKPGQRVLINGASGGVGTFAIQIAKVMGAEVTAVCSTRNVAMVQALGADHVVDYTIESFTKREEQYDVIFDLIGNQPLLDVVASLTPTGTLVLSSGSGGRVFGPMGRIVRALALSLFIKRNLRTFVGKPSRDNLELLRELIESGRVKPEIDSIYPLSETADAIRHFAEEHARGKIVITTGSTNSTEEQN